MVSVEFQRASGLYQGRSKGFYGTSGALKSLRGFQGFSKAFKGSSGSFSVALRTLQGNLIGVSGSSGLG